MGSAKRSHYSFSSCRNYVTASADNTLKIFQGQEYYDNIFHQVSLSLLVVAVSVAANDLTVLAPHSQVATKAHRFALLVIKEVRMQLQI